MQLNQSLSSPTAPFGGYQPPQASYDEFRDRSGNIRPAWRAVAEYFDSIGCDGLRLRAADADQFVRESGATFFVSDDNGKQSRPWQLSTVPLLIDAATWAKIEAGLQQRVRVLEAVLTDLLGPQHLLRDQVFPTALLGANPYFRREYHGLPFAGSVRLNVTATDLARDRDGTWWVTGDRTRAPSGLGYLLENRIVTSRLFPRLIRQNNVTRLAEFFAKLRDQLNALAPQMQDNPRVAILTPGEQSYRYFEDTYLARYLGYTLVQGRDLAVRGQRLNLKTLGGLLPVEVLWRHVSDQACDPLELDPSSTQGVTGLLRMVRAGTVAVANSIGSLLAQMPALLPFLPSAARHLLGEDLLLPSVETYWCGGQRELRYVLDHLDKLVLRPAFAVSGATPLDPSQMSLPAREELVAAIKARPHQYIATRRPARSTTPVWHGGTLHSWHVALRSFHVHADDGVQVLPGGFVRVSPHAHSLDGSPRRGELSQDLWIIGEAPVDHETTLLPPPDAPIELTRSGAELPSRVAEHLFWLGRYVERAESIARLLRTTLTRLAGENDATELPELPRLVAALAAAGQIEPDYAIEEFGAQMPALEQVLPNSLYDLTQPRGMRAGVQQMIKNAAAVRDRISLDAYRIIARIGEDLSDGMREIRGDLGTNIERINRLITDLLAFSGLASQSITRTHGWRFLMLGQRIERGFQSAELLRSTLVQPIADERPLLEALLRTSDSLMTYRSRYLLQLRPNAVIDLLITDETNPRSIAFQVQHIDELIGELPTEQTDCSLGHDQRIAEQLRHRVRMSDPAELAQTNELGQRSLLAALLDELTDQLPKLSDAITSRYLIHTASWQTLTGRSAGDGDLETRG